MADVSEAVRQYADALMLSGESAIGMFGHKALSVLETTSCRIEQWCREEDRPSCLDRPRLGESLNDRIAEQICNSAVEIGICRKSNLISFCTEFGIEEYKYLFLMARSFKC